MVSALQIRTFVKGKYFTHAHFNVEPQILTFLVHITTYVGSITLQYFSRHKPRSLYPDRTFGKILSFLKTSGISFG